VNALARRDISGPKNPHVGFGPKRVREVCRARREDGGLQLRVSHEREAAVVGDVQPLVAVGDDRVCPLDSLDEMARAVREGGEETEGPVHVQPGAVTLREIGHRGQGVEVAGVHLAGTRDHHGGRVAEGLEFAFERGEVEPSGPVRREFPHGIASQPEHRERLRVARMDVARAENRHPRQTAEAFHVDVHALPKAPPSPSTSERGEVRHGRARGEDPAPRPRQTEELLQPAERDRFEMSAQWRGNPGSRVLIPRGCEPVRAERRRRRPTVDEVEEPRPGGVHEAAAALDQLLQRGDGSDAILGKRSPEGCRGVFRVGIADGTIFDRVEVLPRLVRHEGDDGIQLARVRWRRWHRLTVRHQRRRPSSRRISRSCSRSAIAWRFS
jgi:hypothetical protein